MTNNFSYWERDIWLSKIDFTVVGSGIVGINCALQLKNRFPKAKILVLERGLFPNGASTKNAGFACFGSLSEILDDLNSHTPEEVLELVQKRIAGLELLRKNLGDAALDYHQWGSYELFTPENENLFQQCCDKMWEINDLLFPIFRNKVFNLSDNKFGIKNVGKQFILNRFEGQLDTGKMMAALLHKAQSNGILFLNNIKVEEFSENKSFVKVKTNQAEFNTKKLFIATNGFASQLGIAAVKPARAQVLITKPIENLHIKGTFHLDKGYYYFRNINDRILLGGGRNLDFKGEETTELGETELIQKKLEELLNFTILPETISEIDHRWSGIMGVGNQKKAIVKQLSENVFCGVRLGGMGVAIGSLVGKELAELVE